MCDGSVVGVNYGYNSVEKGAEKGVPINYLPKVHVEGIGLHVCICIKKYNIIYAYHTCQRCSTKVCIIMWPHIIRYRAGKNTGMRYENKFTSKNHI